jgi:hypothetical protein
MTHGFEHALGFHISNQVANEEKACDMLATIEASTYSRAGEK